MLITKQSDLDDFCKTLKKYPFITVDTEFLRDKTYYPKLCLIQACTPDGESAAIDVLAKGIDLEPFFKILHAKKILKVLHASRQDLEIFYNLTGKVPAPFFDTQIAAMVCGYGDSVGYESLVRNLTDERIDKSSQFTDWSKRPLSVKQLHYALGDVTHLVKVYDKLSEELEAQKRTSWVYEEEEILADPRTYENDPEKAWERIKVRAPKPKMLAVLKTLAAWREQRAQSKDIPRHWVLRDETLLDLAAQAPTKSEKLKKVRNISPDYATGRKGTEIMALIRDALASDPKTWPKPKQGYRMPDTASALTDILKMLLKVRCQEERVAPRLVAGKSDIEALATQDKPDIPAMKGWRYDVFGKDALALKKGRLAIGLKDSKIIRYKISDETQTF